MMTTPIAPGRIAGAPISWGVCEVEGWGHVLDVDTVLGELRAVGLRATELGPPGFLPDEPSQLRDVLARHEVELVAAFLAVVLHDEAQRDATLAAAERAITQLAAAGGDMLVLAAGTGLAGYDERPVLDGAQWATLVATAAEIRDLAGGKGLSTSLHPHVGTHVEQRDEVLRFLADSDLALCLDTGHLLIGGTDPAALAGQAADRVAHVHLKDVDAALAARVRSGEISYQHGVQAGMYVPLGDGDVPVGQIVQTLEHAGYTGWYVLEQDTALTDGAAEQAARPAKDCARSLRFLGAQGQA